MTTIRRCRALTTMTCDINSELNRFDLVEPNKVIIQFKLRKKTDVLMVSAVALQ